MTERLAPTERFRIMQKDQLIYEWDQTIEEINIFIPLPPKLPSKSVTVTMKRKHITLGLKGNPPYLDGELGGTIKVDSSFWTIEDGVLHISLQKAEKAVPWKGVISGQEISNFSADRESRRLMLERFQAEHAGFDFSGAELSGSCPDPSTFMGGPSIN